VPDQFDLSSLERKARSADHRDGLTELYAAGVFFVFALTWLAGPEFVGIAAVASIMFFPKLVARSKQRITYPRIGYSADVADDSKATARGMLLFIAGAVLLMIAAVWAFGDITDAADWRRAAPLLAGLAFSGGFWFTADKSGLFRYRVLAVASSTVGVTAWALSEGKDYEPVGYYLLTMGVLLLVVGVAALVGFMRRNPVHDEDHV
jgi:hypothetical protein